MAWKNDPRSATERGYGYRWRKLRLHILARDLHLCKCEECNAAGRIKLATHVDHKVSKADWLTRHGNLHGVDDPANLRAINAECHKRKTMTERGAEPREHHAIGADGMPSDPNHPWNGA